jgi:hypothetical protein
MRSSADSQEIDELTLKVANVTKEQKREAIIRQADNRRLKKLITYVGLGTTIAGIFAWGWNYAGDYRERVLSEQKQIEDIRHAKEERELMKKAIRANRVLIVDGIDHISSQLERIDPAVADEQEPTTLTNAREAADDDRANAALFDLDAGTP